MLGFDEFARTMPSTAVTRRLCLDRNSRKFRMLINILLDAKVDSITSFRRSRCRKNIAAFEPTPKPTPSPAPGQEEWRRQRKPGGTADTEIDRAQRSRYHFKAAPGAARKVLNEITDSTSQFFIIRTLYVHNEKDKGPPHERTATPTPTPNPQASPGQQGAGALNFIVGNEHVEVSATIEMLRFTF